MKTLLVLVLALVLLIPLAGTVFAAPVTTDTTVAPAKTTRVPFKATMQSNETYSTAFYTLFVTGNGTGEGTELGRFTASYHMETNELDMSVTESLSITGSNGDGFQANAVGQAIEDRTPGMFKVVEIYTITSGTGRFAGASGTLTLNRLLSFTTGVASSTLEGYILLPSN